MKPGQHEDEETNTIKNHPEMTEVGQKTTIKQKRNIDKRSTENDAERPKKKKIGP